MSHPTTIEAAVIMRKEPIVGAMSRWQPWRWVLDDVLVLEHGAGEVPRRIRQDEAGREWWLHPGFEVALFRDDAEGYYLNASTPAPAWFVLWRMEEESDVAEEPIARPVAVSLSYHDAGRWLDAQETVEQVPAPAEILAWLNAFIEQHYVPEPKRRKRPESFRPLTDRFGNPATVSTGQKRGGGGGDE